MRGTTHHPPPGDHSHEVHLPPRKTEVAPKVNATGFEPAAYTDSLAAAARGKQARFEQLATAPAPYASTSDEAERFAGFQDKHLRPRGREVADKVNEAGPGGCEYVANLASISQGKQERFYRAATAPAPYAVAAGCCAGEAAAFPAEHVLLERKREVVGKVGSADFDPALYSHSLAAVAEGKAARFERAASAPAPFALDGSAEAGAGRFPPEHHLLRKGSQDIKGKPQEAAYDAGGAAAARAANEMCKLSTVARNHGVPGLLRQDL